MALGKCRECKKEVSDQASKCPHCGVYRPVKKEYPKWLYTLAKVIWGFVFLIFILLALVVLFPIEDEKASSPVETTEQKAQRLIECRKNTECWTKEYEFEAQYLCKEIVDNRTKYDVEWMDNISLFSPADYVPFYSDASVNKETGEITYLGKSLKLQNGFGAWSKIGYMCKYNPSTQRASLIFDNE